MGNIETSGTSPIHRPVGFCLRGFFCQRIIREKYGETIFRLIAGTEVGVMTVSVGDWRSRYRLARLERSFDFQ